jgi:membrane associated rhomboid family serine protease
VTGVWPQSPDEGGTWASPAAPAPPAPPPPQALTCYRHSRAEAPVACNRCDRPICTDCMVSAPVGWQCPSCVKGGPVVRNMRDIAPGASLVGERPYITFGLIGACVIGYLLKGAPSIGEYVLTAFGVADGRLEQLVTYGFLHADLIHIGFNMAILYQLGLALEPRLGRIRFGALYLAGLLGGAVGSLALTNPRVGAVGASGAVFALMGATLVLPRRSRFGIEGSVGALLVMNLVITFIPGLNISIGGHIGGLAVGLVVGGVYRLVGERPAQMRSIAGAAFAVVVAIALVIAATPVAEWSIRRHTG